nr:DUF4386 family protein [Serinibacter arcticus]
MTSDSIARAARLAGVLYLVTFATSIPALALKTPALDPTAPLTTSAASAATWGGVLEVLLAVACVGTALLLLPAIRPAGDALALGLVAARTSEAGLILLGVVALLGVVTVRSAGTTTAPPSPHWSPSTTGPSSSAPG